MWRNIWAGTPTGSREIRGSVPSQRFVVEGGLLD